MKKSNSNSTNLEKCISGNTYFNMLANCYVNHYSGDTNENTSELLMWSLLIDLTCPTHKIDKCEPEKLKGNKDWLEQLCFLLFAYLSCPKETQNGAAHIP